MKILITGSRGTLASALGAFARSAGHQTLGLVRARPTNPAGAPERESDLEPGRLAALLDDYRPDLVFHGAGTASVAQSFADPAADFESAVGTWRSVLEGVRRARVRPALLFPSSAAVYGNTPAQPIGEGAPLNPVSPYGFHKLCCEVLAREYAECFGLSVTVFRIFSVFGAAQRRLLVWELFQKCRGPEPEVLLDGTGDESRDYLALPDAVDAMLRAGAAAAPGLRTLNLASGRERSIREVAEQVLRLTGAAKPLRFRGQARRGDPLRWRADVRALEALLPGWAPRPFEERLAECIGAWSAPQAGRG